LNDQGLAYSAPSIEAKSASVVFELAVPKDFLILSFRQLEAGKGLVVKLAVELHMTYGKRPGSAKLTVCDCS
jgi:hypothetical protein